MQDVIDWFNSVDTSTLGEVDLTDDDSGTISTTTTTGGGEEDEAEGDPEEVACYQNAGSLGWIMCPMIFGLRGIGEKFYAVAEPFLGLVVLHLPYPFLDQYRHHPSYHLHH